MENNTNPQKQFTDSALAFLESLQGMEKFSDQIGDREANTAERVEGLFRFGDLMLKMLIAARDGDNWLKGH